LEQVIIEGLLIVIDEDLFVVHVCKSTLTNEKPEFGIMGLDRVCSLIDCANLIKSNGLFISAFETLFEYQDKVPLSGEIIDFEFVFRFSKEIVPPDGYSFLGHQQEDVSNFFFIIVIHAPVHLKVEFVFLQEKCKLFWFTIKTGWGFEP
jgi:hypothetical protein